MTWLIIGSTAMHHWFDDARLPKDLDILTPAKITSTNVVECAVDSSWHELAEEIISSSKDPVFADPDLLFTLKVSHAHWDVFFEKTLFDIEFLKKKGAKLNIPLYEKLVKVWEKVHGKKHVNMNQSADTFWNDAVRRDYPHDYVHECVKFHEYPLHEKIRPNMNSTWCDEGMFNSLSEDDQAKCALEELLVTAIERSHLTKESTRVEILRAASRAYRNLTTSMTKGWFSRYLILNHYNLFHERKEQWLAQIKIALNKL